MATFVGTADKVYLGAYSLTGYTRMVNFGDLTREMKDATTFNDGGYTSVLPGLIKGSAKITGNQDFTNVDPNFNSSSLGTQFPLTVYPNPTGTVAAGDAAWLSRGVFAKLNPLGSGQKGEVAGFEFDIDYDTVIAQGKVAAPNASITSTTNGTAVALTGPTASQSLYAALHVTAYSGLTNVVFTIESDDNSGFLSPTTRITFATVTALTSEWKSVAGNFSTETYHRVVATVTGTGSISFTCAFGVL